MRGKGCDWDGTYGVAGKDLLDLNGDYKKVCLIIYFCFALFSICVLFHNKKVKSEKKLRSINNQIPDIISFEQNIYL